MGKQESMTKVLSRAAHKKASTNKLTHMRDRVDSNICLSRQASRSILKKALGQNPILKFSGENALVIDPISQCLDMENGNNPAFDVADLPPAMPRRTTSVDEPKSAAAMSPRRRSRRLLEALSRSNGHRLVSAGEQGDHHNAVFPTVCDLDGDSGMSNIGHSPFMDSLSSRVRDAPPKRTVPSYKSEIVDMPPKMASRNSSVSALASFANIKLKSSTSLARLPKVSPETKDRKSMAVATLKHEAFKRPVNVSCSPTSIVNEPVTVEVSYGVHARLRGAEETWGFIQKDFYLSIGCGLCKSELCCIKDVDMVLCPACGVMTSTESVSDGPRGGGVGLGLTLDDLKNWESGNRH